MKVCPIKPRIAAIFGQWICFSDDCGGRGLTPRDAYIAWFLNWSQGGQRAFR